MEALPELCHVLLQGRKRVGIDVDENVVTTSSASGRTHQVPAIMLARPIGDEIRHSVTSSACQVDVHHTETRPQPTKHRRYTAGTHPAQRGL
ncbi:hypothetical protein ACFRJ9_21665 [Paenarthrobacter sp. NPDC056912]|uniref:hypothetical protein n=1 Tax=Paenarthrobacter sp. NPDC056912 TaxID=3345965 RepID=UPI00366B6C8F